MALYKEIKSCRICGNQQLDLILNLGTLALTGIFPKNKSEEVPTGPLNLIKCRESENRIFLIGNGGSASTASHFTSDLLKTAITKGSKHFKAYSLTDNMSVVLAWANDLSYDNIFQNQLENQIGKK